MATLSEIKQETLYWQRLLKFGGYYRGKLDGLTGPLTREAEQAWLSDHEEVARRFGRYGDRTEAHLQTILPMFAICVRGVLADIRQGREDWVLTCGTRSWAEQSRIYAQGRTAPGSKVTNANAGQSLHNYGLAVDFVLLRVGKAIWDDREYSVLGKASARQGIVWGGTFRSFPDAPHVQMTDHKYSDFYMPFLKGTQSFKGLM